MASLTYWRQFWERVKYNHWNFRATLQMVKPTIVPTKKRTKQQFVMYFTLLLKHSSPMSKCFSLGSCSLLYVMTIGLCRQSTRENTTQQQRMYVCTYAHGHILELWYLDTLGISHQRPPYTHPVTHGTGYCLVWRTHDPFSAILYRTMGRMQQ